MTKSEATQGTPKYRLKFLPEALDEWNALDGSVKEVLRKALKKRLEQPRTPGVQLHGDLHDCYKIKLRKQGYRLVYSVEDDILIVLVLAIDKREDMAAYRSMVRTAHPTNVLRSRNHRRVSPSSAPAPVHTRHSSFPR